MKMKFNDLFRICIRFPDDTIFIPNISIGPGIPTAFPFCKEGLTIH